ncbi:Sensor protein FixL [Fundidesulfovibrio magnetotacticus]|uniref:histidine kinase n=1 Tax=Fundidesulfovibrio magnetotacticus TaxID=2730080 RepID=A0A6V8LU63_9BACT|nr:ATP-binding protein [Fundidesulfovibrio magnetotacticus]GFK93649.1 Sensor protein FixL [Fundidesulfovibrio magnetotacticus]
MKGLRGALTRRLASDRQFLAVLLAVFAGAVVSTALAYSHTRKTVEALARTQFLQSLDFLDHEVDVQVRGMIFQTRLVSQEPVLLLALEESYLGGSARAAARRKLESLVEDGVFERFYLMNMKGAIVLASNPALAGTLDVSDRRYYREAREGRPALETVETSRVTARPILVASQPVRAADGSVRGVVVAIRDTAAFARDILALPHLGGLGVGFILGKHGSVLAAPPQGDQPTFQPDPFVPLIVHGADSNQLVRFDRQGVTRICLAKINRITGWILAVEADDALVLSPVNHLAAVNVGVALGTLALVALALGALRKVLANLRRSEERFSMLFRLSPEAALLLDANDLSVLAVNEAYTRLTGYAPSEVLGRSIPQIQPEIDRARLDAFHADVLRGGRVVDREFEGRRNDGQTFRVSVSGQIIESESGLWLMILLHDVTQARKIQEMMIQTEKMLSVGGIAAGIAHEINNPLGIVVQASQNLVQRTRPDHPKNIEAAREVGVDMGLVARYFQARQLDVFVQDIQGAALRAASIIRHMLDFSRSSESRRKPCDLAAILEKALSLAANDYDLKKSYDFKRITIDRDFEPNLPSVPCTETEIEQVFLNILRNAAQAMAEAPPRPEGPRIGLRLRALSGRVQAVFEDNGPGMSPEARRRAFEPFYTTKAPGVGTGLGLSVSYFIVVKGHGGRMTLDSAQGRGARFTLELPLGDAPLDPAA